ncbi:MAG: DUF4157 domain-containing protein [Sediminibacterium sp.]|nr:DUF4157 domain-containing protein [Sediminibacterium sp.]
MSRYNKQLNPDKKEAKHFNDAERKTVSLKATGFTDNRPAGIQFKQKAEDEEETSARPAQKKAKSGTVIQAKSKGNLPEQLQSGIEQLSGMAMNDVKVHYNSPRPAQLQAHAYAQGTDIHLAPGQEKHLPHEAWHVAQQKQGRVKATKQLKGKVNINDDAGLEKEADVMGAKALQVKETTPVQRQLVTGGKGMVAQREKEKEDKVGTGGVELQEAIRQLRELAVKDAAHTENAERYQTVIAALEEVASGKDEALKDEVAQGVKQELEKIAAELKGPETEVSPESQPKDVVQGVWGLDFILSLIQSNPKTSIAVGLGLLAVERIVAHYKKKKLPAKLSNNLFARSKQQYWVLVKRKIKEFAKQLNLVSGDVTLLTQCCLDAINVSKDENDFLYARLPGRLGSTVFANPNLSQFMAFMGDHFVAPLKNDVDSVANRSIATQVVPPNQIKPFSEALKKMSFVKRLYNGTIQEDIKKENKQFNKIRRKGAWKNGGSAVSEIQEVDDGYWGLTRDRREIDNGNFRKNVMKADHFIKLMVEPSVLGQVKRPLIRVHLRNQMTPYRPHGFRAFHNNQGEVHVAQDEDVQTLVHEMGHHIEDELPILAWSDIQKLLEGRNLDKSKSTYIYLHSYSEQRFGGEYAATGKYTSKYYEGGATEVTSMTSEYLSHPQRFKDLIEKDPQQAAVILRILRPHEFSQVKALKKFQKYLPN